MPEVVELYAVDDLCVGALGPPGRRVFVISAAKGSDRVTVAVEKEQVALLAREATQFLDKLAEEYPEERTFVEMGAGSLREPVEPLFRARLIGIGFDPDDQMVLVELRESAVDEAASEETGSGDEGWVARFFATRAQVRALASSGLDAVQAGRARWN